MRIVTQEIAVYTFKTAGSNLRDKIRYYLGQSIYDGAMEERIKTLEELAKRLDCKLDYELSTSPARGERITMRPLNSYEATNQLFKKIRKLDPSECPLTGVSYDADILFDLAKMPAQAAFDKYIKSIQSEFEAMMSDEYLADYCEANNYEFTEDGRLCNGE